MLQYTYALLRPPTGPLRGPVGGLNNAYVDHELLVENVDHELLVEKLNVYGIRGVANKWLQNYLANIKQYVVINDDCVLTC